MYGPSSRNLRQTITYWAPNGADEWGQESFLAPVKVSGRWSEQSETITTASGDTYVSKATVWLPMAVEKGGYLALGDYTLASPNPQANPKAVPDAGEVQAYREVPDLRNIEQERRAYL